MFVIMAARNQGIAISSNHELVSSKFIVVDFYSQCRVGQGLLSWFLLPLLLFTKNDTQLSRVCVSGVTFLCTTIDLFAESWWEVPEVCVQNVTGSIY